MFRDTPFLPLVYPFGSAVPGPTPGSHAPAALGNLAGALFLQCTEAMACYLEASWNGGVLLHIPMNTFNL